MSFYRFPNSIMYFCKLFVFQRTNISFSQHFLTSPYPNSPSPTVECILMIEFEVQFIPYFEQDLFKIILLKTNREKLNFAKRFHGLILHVLIDGDTYFREYCLGNQLQIYETNRSYRQYFRNMDNNLFIKKLIYIEISIEFAIYKIAKTILSKISL